MLGLIWIKSVLHSNDIPKGIILKKMILKTKTQQQKQQTTKEYHIISRGGGGGGAGGQRVYTIFPVYSSKIKVSGLKNYTGCAEWYSHAFLAYT